MTDQSRIDDLLALPADRRLAIIEALWNSLAADPASVPIPQWHRNLLAERLAADDTDTSLGQSWDEVRREIESGLAKK
jgi:putative addiction module component (TIGR02574 family)